MKQWITCYYLGGGRCIFINGYKICVGEQVARGTNVERDLVTERWRVTLLASQIIL